MSMKLFICSTKLDQSRIRYVRSLCQNNATLMYKYMPCTLLVQELSMEDTFYQSSLALDKVRTCVTS